MLKSDLIFPSNNLDKCSHDHRVTFFSCNLVIFFKNFETFLIGNSGSKFLTEVVATIVSKLSLITEERCSIAVIRRMLGLHECSMKMQTAI